MGYKDFIKGIDFIFQIADIQQNNKCNCLNEKIVAFMKMRKFNLQAMLLEKLCRFGLIFTILIALHTCFYVPTWVFVELFPDEWGKWENALLPDSQYSLKIHSQFRPL